jgi:tetratricopeptide (TPR) repeat protein
VNFLNAARAGDRSQLLLAACWAVVMLLAVSAYYPGLAGPFLLDDFGSIKTLGDYGGVTDWESFKVFVFNGNAGPTGRPVSMLTFLIDANNWPADAWPFKRTNLVIHLLTGVMLGILISSVLALLEFDRRDARWITFLATAAWVLHPFLVSTTLYAAQRMAQLSTLFVFAGLAMYLYGRSILPANSRKAYVLMALAVGGFTLLATLSKENGILLPLLVGVIEVTVVASRRDRLVRLNRYWSAAFIGLPTVVIVLYLARASLREGFFGTLPYRDFSVYERLLTQGRVLAEYLQHWFLPKLYTTGVFQDHFLKSTGLFDPLTTLLSIVLHAVLIGIAFVKRREWPLFALAVLFFYVSHLLESTVLNLELYFEHRNYVAAAFLFVPLVAYLRRKVSARVFGLVGVVVVLVLGSFLRFSATVWQSLPSMVESSALKAPTSARAQSQYAKLLFLAGRPDDALAVIDRAVVNIPGDDPLLITNQLYFLCSQNRLGLADFESAAGKLAVQEFDSRALTAYNGFSQEVVSGNCPNITAANLEQMYTRMLDVPRNGDPTTLQYSHVQFLVGYSRLYAGKPRGALEAFEDSLAARPGSSHAMAMAAILASHGDHREALILSDRALGSLRDEMTADPHKAHKVRESDILAFQETVRADLSAGQQSPDSADPAD